MHAEHDADAPWVAALAGCTVGRAGTAIAEAEGAVRLYRHLARLHARHGRSSYVEIDAPLELFALVRLLRPRHVVEVGVSSGVSSAYLLEALARNGLGRLHSIDLPRFEGRARPSASWSLPRGCGPGWAVPPRLIAGWDLRVGDKRHLLPILAEQLPLVDLFVYDVPHEDAVSRVEFRGLDRLLGPEGVAIADHGPGGGACAALASWARIRGRALLGRRGLGLYGFGARPVGRAPAGERTAEVSGTGSLRSAAADPVPVRGAPVVAIGA